MSEVTGGFKEDIKSGWKFSVRGIQWSSSYVYEFAGPSSLPQQPYMSKSFYKCPFIVGDDKL